MISQVAYHCLYSNCRLNHYKIKLAVYVNIYMQILSKSSSNSNIKPFCDIKTDLL